MSSRLVRVSWSVMAETNGATTDVAVEYFGETKPRRRWLAVLLTFLCPGLGYMYVGQLLKGVTINLLFLLMAETFVIVFGILKFFPLLPLIVLVVAWLIFSGFAAFGAVGHIEDESEYVLKGYNHWMIYAVVVLLTFTVPIGATAHFISVYLLGTHEVAAPGMYPTLRTGDVVLVDLAAYRDRAPQRGDLVTVRARGDREVILRVVGVAGDVVRIEGETVFVNSEPLDRSPLDDQALRVPSLDDGDLLAMVEHNNGNRYVISVSPKAFNAQSIAPTKIAADEFFVLADNRSQVGGEPARPIRDSRDFGAVALRDVTGRPLYIAWSRAADSDVRWDRVGLRTQ